jgi:DNA-binding LacI/PurR family transcriptional regulator
MVEGTPQRLAGEFRQKIERGEWAVGGRLPTTRELATIYRVSVNTIKTAFRELEADEMVERRPRIGGYVKSRHPRPAPLRAATTIAVVGPQERDGGFMGGEWGFRITQGLAAALATSGFHTANFPYFTPDDGTGRARVLEKIDQAGETLAGTFVFIFEQVAGLLGELDRRNIPWVTLNRPSQNATQNFVTHDAFRGGRVIGRCFARLGYERAVILSDALGMGRSAADKFHGFTVGWLESGRRLRDMEFLYCPTFHEHVGHDAFADYVEKNGPPRAVFTAGDYLALGALRVCRERGLSVPDQVAVIGSTGLEFAQHTHPTLSVLDTPMEQMGAAAGQMLLEMAQEGVRRMTGRYVKAGLILRESCPIPQDLLEREQAVVDQFP